MDIYFRAAGFLRRFCRRIFPVLVRKKCIEKSSRRIPGKCPKIYTTEIPDNFSAEGPGQSFNSIRSRPGKPNQRKGQNKKFMNFAHYCEFWCFSLGKQARFTLNFCSGMPPGKFMNWPFFGLVCRGHSLIQGKTKGQQLKGKIVSEFFTLFHNFSHFFIIFPPGLSPSKQRVLAQGEQKIRKDNKKNWTNRFCTLVVARLSSS